MIDDAVAAAIFVRLNAALAAPRRGYRPLRVGADIVGHVDHGRAARLMDFREAFVVDDAGVTLLPTLQGEPSRTAMMAQVAAQLAIEGALSPWRNELYAVAPTFGAAPWFRLERAAARYFGVHTWAVHINGVVRAAPEPQMWFARRSHTKAIDPGMLDNLVGGGIPAGSTLAETLAREAWEEAGIPDDVVARALAAGVVHLWREQPDGLQSETIFVNDLWLREDFFPANLDGEAAEHRRVALDEAARLIAVAAGPHAVTADASLVVLDFLLRHGVFDTKSPSFSTLAALRHSQAAARRA